MRSEHVHAALGLVLIAGIAAAEGDKNPQKTLEEMRRRSVVSLGIDKPYHCVETAAVYVMLERGWKVREDKGNTVIWVGDPVFLMHKEVRVRFDDEGNKTRIVGRIYGVVTATGDKHQLIADEDVGKLRSLMQEISQRAITQPCAKGS